MRLIDTNVFIYAAGAEHAYREPCKRALAAISGGAFSANMDTEVLQEILHYYRSRARVEFGRVVMLESIGAFPEPFEVSVAVMRSAADVLVRHTRLQSRDAVHAAVVMENGLEGIISADCAFDEITGIKRFDPKEF